MSHHEKKGGSMAAKKASTGKPAAKTGAKKAAPKAK